MDLGSAGQNRRLMIVGLATSTRAPGTCQLWFLRLCCCSVVSESVPPGPVITLEIFFSQSFSTWRKNDSCTQFSDCLSLSRILLYIRSNASFSPT